MHRDLHGARPAHDGGGAPLVDRARAFQQRAARLIRRPFAVFALWQLQTADESRPLVAIARMQPVAGQFPVPAGGGYWIATFSCSAMNCFIASANSPSPPAGRFLSQNAI